ncbi:hypothetical protein AVO42_09215 [Thiomicrospira sp. XS5]|uniref:6-hydroxymethylpterin diphosphokinase MptE-like protein n=1 Tax=Thiomicrospira sp. XS5 TaxID=1775636 RepID=UPI00074742B8|nr:6-hydroxymethylpterin diphosphokinase MptE-like protein [Thiomicrospira sp. XS5]KUJ75489.1 hypothetical protein AVO42_09215 [Thiomicrospira sp. XS5]
MEQTRKFIMLIGSAELVLSAQNQSLLEGGGERTLLLSNSQPGEQVPSKLSVCVVKDDLVTALLPYYALFVGSELEISVLSPSSQWAVSIQQQLPQALEDLAYMQLRFQYAPFVDNALMNAAKLTHPIIDYSDCCEGRTAVVLGAAPSLNQVLPWLKANRERVVVFAVARLAKRLQAENIIPDFFVASDPTAATLAHAEGLDAFQSKSVLIVQHYASPVLLEVWQGAVVYWGPDWPQHSKDYQTERNVEIEGGTVANLAVLSALGLGCRTVYCAGMDFCFDVTGVTHESSSLEAKANVKREQAETIENYQGDWCDTTLEFLSAVEAFPLQFETLTQRYGLSADFQVFNVNAKAAKINGIELADLNALVVPSLSEIDISSLIVTLTLSEQQHRKRLQETLATLQRYQKHYRQLAELAKKGRKFFVNTSEEAMRLAEEALDFIQKAQKAHKKLEKSVQGDTSFIQRYGFADFSTVIQQANQLQVNSNDMVLHYRYFKSVFEAYEQTTAGLVKSYEKAIHKTRFQMEELKKEKDFSALSTLWLAEKRPYRFLGWRQRFPEVVETLEAEKPNIYQMLMESLLQWQAECRDISQETFAYLSSQPHKLERK